MGKETSRSLSALASLGCHVGEVLGVSPDGHWASLRLQVATRTGREIVLARLGTYVTTPDRPVLRQTMLVLSLDEQEDPSNMIAVPLSLPLLLHTDA